MKVAGFLLIVLIFIMSVPHPNAALTTDFVEIDGYVYDTKGNPIKGVYVEAFSLTPPWTYYGYAGTDVKGYYLLSLDRPKRLDFPVQDFSNGRPVYEGYIMHVGWPVHGSKEWLPIYCKINTENKNAVKQDFILKPAGEIRLKAYSSDGTLIQEFPGPDNIENATRPVYTTDFYWRVIRSQFMWDRAIFLVSLNTPNVLNIPWDVPGFGKVVLRADNDGKGFTLTRQGETITINLNHELAKTECRLLRESYEKYLNEGYIFSNNLSSNIQSAFELLQKADSVASDAQKAHFADLCLNRTLWTGESLELERALQDIEKYRKGNAILQLVDENGKPIKDVNVTISQLTHDFLFGVLMPEPLRSCWSDAAELFREAGINYGLLELHWGQTEPSLGEYRLPYTLSEVDHLRKMGFRIGAEGLICLEPPNVWETGLLNLGFEQLKGKIYEHVHRLVSEYSDYVDYWTVVHNADTADTSLGFSREQVTDLIKAGVAAVRSADPTAQILVSVDHICGWDTAEWLRLTYGEYTIDPYTFLSNLNEYGIDHDGIAPTLCYCTLYELPPEFGSFGGRFPLPFRDLASISRILDWYATLSEPIQITEFHVPGNFTSNLGYWHRRSWDEKLKAEWIGKSFTIAFSKPFIKEMLYWCAIDKDYQKANRGLLDATCSPRESYYTLKRLITENWTTRLHMTTDANGQVEFRGFAGEYNITVSTKDFTGNFKIHVYEGASKAYTINLSRARPEGVDRAKAELAIAQAGEAVSRAKAEGRTIYLDRAENLLEHAGKALMEENYTQAILLAEEAMRAADLAMTWLVIPATIAFAGAILSGSVILYRRVRKKK